MKKIMLIATMCLFVGCSAFYYNGEIESGFFKAKENILYEIEGMKKNVIQFPDGSNVPAGYHVIEIEKYRGGIVTINCKYRHYINSVILKICKKLGADAFILSEIKLPDGITDTCFRSKILILKRE